MMNEIEIYTTKFCPYCLRAKKLLKTKGIQFTEIPVDFNRRKRADMTLRSHGRHTVPQIFINGEHIGGCDDLFALESAGQLEGKLTGINE